MVPQAQRVRRRVPSEVKRRKIGRFLREALVHETGVGRAYT
jgi:hypothetical protein